MSARVRWPLVAVAVALTTAPPAATGQFRAPRSADYLFVALDADARTLWVNPASLGTEFVASVMGEAFGARDANGDFGLRQFSVGFNSRGFGFGYRRDRFDDSTGGNTYRFGFGRGFRRLAVGGSVTVYTAETDQREGTVGIRFFLIRSLEVGAVIDHIGKPTVRGVRLPLSGTAGVAWAPLGRHLHVTGQVQAVDRELVSGYDVTFRGGVRFVSGGRTPFGVLGVVDLDRDAALSRVAFGLQLGGAERGVLVGHANRTGGETSVDGVSLVGIATRPLR